MKGHPGCNEFDGVWAFFAVPKTPKRGQVEAGRESCSHARGATSWPQRQVLTHRAYMFGDGKRGIGRADALRGEDCESTLGCMIQLGLSHEWIGETEVRLTLRRNGGSQTRRWIVEQRNTIRLLSGLLASRNLDCTLVGMLRFRAGR